MLVLCFRRASYQNERAIFHQGERIEERKVRRTRSNWQVSSVVFVSAYPPSASRKMATCVESGGERAPAAAASSSAPIPRLPGWNEALIKNRAVQVLTVGDKALICCKYEDLKNVSFRQHSSRYCAVPGCKNFRGKVPSLSFFQFPKDLQRCKKWIDFCNRDDLRGKDAANLYRSGHSICAEHFEGSMFMNALTRNRLIHCAVPTVVDPLRPPPTPSSIKELATLSRASKVRSQMFPGESDLCSFHHKFLKSLTALDMDDEEIHFCMRCGLPIKERKWMSATVFRVICKIGHDTTFSTEFAQGCHDWVSNCHKMDRMNVTSIPANACHLCNGHFVDLQSVSQTSQAGETCTDKAPRFGSTLATPSVTSSSGTMQFPSLPSSFFLVRDYATPPKRSIGKYSVATQTRGSYVRASSKVTVDVKKYRLLWTQNYRMKKKMALLEERLKIPPKIDVKFLSTELSRFLSGPFLRLVQEQLKARTVQLHGMRWSDDVIALAQVIRAESPTAYAILRRLLPLPARNVLRRHPKPTGGLPSLDLYLRNTYPPDGVQPVSIAEALPVIRVVKPTSMIEPPSITIVEPPAITMADPAAITLVEQPIAMEEGDVEIHPQELIEAPIRLVAASDGMHIYEVLTTTAIAAEDLEAVCFEEAACSAAIAAENVDMMQIEEAACAAAIAVENMDAVHIEELV